MEESGKTEMYAAHTAFHIATWLKMHPCAANKM